MAFLGISSDSSCSPSTRISSNSLTNRSRGQPQRLVLLSCRVSCSLGLALLLDTAVLLAQCLWHLRLLSRLSKVPVTAGTRWTLHLLPWKLQTQTWGLLDSSSSKQQ